VSAFGFKDKTNIDLPGEANSIIQKKPTRIDMSIAAFGQGLQITPLQLVMAYSSIANGGKLLKPQIVKELTDSSGNVVKRYDAEFIRNVISKQTSDTLKDSLKGVVLKGTGANAYISQYEVAGKTGTAQTFEKDGKRSEKRFISSFIGFAPADNPVICVLVVCDYPSITSHFGGMVAAPVVKEVMEESLNYMKIEKRPVDETDVQSNNSNGTHLND
jgi:stage V sporulation protein D (sporulation-specific penicillin-binding protein)